MRSLYVFVVLVVCVSCEDACSYPYPNTNIFISKEKCITVNQQDFYLYYLLNSHDTIKGYWHFGDTIYFIPEADFILSRYTQKKVDKVPFMIMTTELPFSYEFTYSGFSTFKIDVNVEKLTMVNSERLYYFEHELINQDRIDYNPNLGNKPKTVRKYVFSEKRGFIYFSSEKRGVPGFSFPY